MHDFSSAMLRMLSRLGPSGAVGMAATQLADIHPEVVFLTADLCFFSGLERYKSLYPDRFYNVGIAEQNLIGIAAGLAHEGFIPFATTYASFACSRCADQVRVNMAYANLPIKLIGLTSGFAAGILGATHMCIEDVAYMRALPNITVLSPADCVEIVKCFEAAVDIDGPVYIRLTGPLTSPIVYQNDYLFEVGKSIILKSGTEVAIVATGSMVYQSLKAAELLEQKGVSCSVVNMHTLKPLDTDVLEKLSAKHKLLVTVEEHNVIGGLGSAISEYLIMKSSHCKVLNLGIQDYFPNAGDYDYLLKQCGLTSEQICQRVITQIPDILGV